MGGFHHHRFLTGFWLVLVFLPFFGGKETPAKLHVMKSKKVSAVSQGFLTGFLALFALTVIWSPTCMDSSTRTLRNAALHNRAALCPTFSPLHLHNIFHLELELFIYFFDYWSKPNWNPSNILCHLCVLRRLEALHTEPVYNFIDSHMY